MNKYPGMSRQLVDGLQPRNLSHAPQERFDFHYHPVDEWLEVLEGTMTFFSAGEVEYSLVTGEALYIPQGEIHRVEIGDQGVRYQMWVPAFEGGFRLSLDDKDMSLVRKNLKLPEVENDWDERNREAPTAENKRHEKFLKDILSADLKFRNAAGTIFDRKGYLDRGPGALRKPSDSIRILYKHPETMLLSTGVYTDREGTRQSFSNYRLFAREGGAWKCRIWMNYPDPAPVE